VVRPELVAPIGPAAAWRCRPTAVRYRRRSHRPVEKGEQAAAY
jgi:hypothetical protein